MSPIEKTDHQTTLECEAVEADRYGCSECGDTAQGEKLAEVFHPHGRAPSRA